MPQPTSFETMNKMELIALNPVFATSLSNAMSKADMLQALKDDGVTWGAYQAQLKGVEEDEPDLAGLDRTPLYDEPVDELEDDEEMTVMKMERKNKTYEVRGHKFTQDHPYALVKEVDVDFLMTQGFRIASGREIAEYYAS